MMNLKPFKANKSLNITMFVQSFCDILEEAKLALSYSVARANYKQFRITQSFSKPHLVKVAFFPIAGKEFEVMVNLKDLNADPEEYLDNTMEMINEAANKLRGDKTIEIIH